MTDRERMAQVDDIWQDREAVVHLLNAERLAAFQAKVPLFKRGDKLCQVQSRAAKVFAAPRVRPLPLHPIHRQGIADWRWGA